eukprot:scaffold8318_cov99-Isochrysis_galbana.AAC.1
MVWDEGAWEGARICVPLGVGGSALGALQPPSRRYIHFPPTPGHPTHTAHAARTIHVPLNGIQ